jgi:hypothetical protein
MRNFTLFRICIIAAISLSFVSCKSEIENFSSDEVKDYIPLTTGKYVTYRMDSTVFTVFGTVTEVHSYQVKHEVDRQITDNEGRLAYRIFRYRRDLAGTQNWEPFGTLIVTPVGNQIEITEDNLRYIKLHMPMRQDYSWSGNSYLPTSPYNNLFQFSNDDFMQLWNYTYTSTNDVFNYNQQNLPNVVSVLHIDERIKLDTVNVATGNTATIPKNATGVFLQGTATDTIRITAQAPDPGRESLTIYNQTNKPATLSSIVIPAGLGFTFQYANGKWSYQNALTVAANAATLPRIAYVATIVGTATDTIRVNTAQLDTNRVRAIRIYNRSNKVTTCNFNAAMNALPIPPGAGRHYELFNGSWRMYNNSNVLLATDPYVEGTALGSTNYSIEKYAKNIGMVYKELLMWEYQPNPTGAGGNFFGFGVKLTMIDHN